MAFSVPPPTQGFNPLGFLVPAFEGLLRGQEFGRERQDLQNLLAQGQAPNLSNLGIGGIVEQADTGFVPQSQRFRAQAAQNAFQNQALRNQPITPTAQAGLDVQRESIQQRRDAATATARRITEAPLTETQLRAREIQRIQRTPPNERTPEEQDILDIWRKLKTTPMTQLERDKAQADLDNTLGTIQQRKDEELRSQAGDLRDQAEEERRQSREERDQQAFEKPDERMIGDELFVRGESGDFEPTGIKGALTPNEEFAQDKLNAARDIERRKAAGENVKEAVKMFDVLYRSGDTLESKILTEKQEVDIAVQQNKDFNARQIVKDLRDMQVQAGRMGIAFQDSLGEGGNVFNDQVLINTFNKMVDPGSVVRESEYARTGAGLPMLNRIEGYFDRVFGGGAGLTDVERKDVFDISQQFLEQARKMFNETYSEFDTRADRIGDEGLDKGIVFGDVKPFKLQETPESLTKSPAIPEGGINADPNDMTGTVSGMTDDQLNALMAIPADTSKAAPNIPFDLNATFQGNPATAGEFQQLPSRTATNLKLNKKIINPGIIKEINKLPAPRRFAIWKGVGEIANKQWKHLSRSKREQILRDLDKKAQPIGQRLLR